MSALGGSWAQYGAKKAAEGGVNTHVRTSEEKALLRERRRVESLILNYSKAPNRYDEPYVLQLEQMAHQYGIPFQRAGAGFLSNAGAAVGGFVDSFLWDMIPDDWYSSEATATARKMGKGAGLGAAVLLSGGTSLLGRGMTKFAQSGIGRFTTAGAALGAKKALAPGIAAAAKQGGWMGGAAEAVAGTKQFANVGKMKLKDLHDKAAKLAKAGDKKGALSAVESAGALNTDAAKVGMAKVTGAVSPGVEAQVYAATKGIGKAATAARPGSPGAVEQILQNVVNAKGAGPKTKKAVNAFLKDKNKVDELTKILNDPNTDVDMAVKLIQDIVPKNLRSKVANRSDIIQTLTSFYGFSGIGG